MKPLAPLLLLLLASTAFAAERSLQRCRAVADDAARLACYDAIALPSAAPAAAARPAPESAQARFGLEPKTPSAELKAIESHIPGRFEGWGPRTVFRLANGQSWQVSDGSTGVFNLENPKVKVRRGVLGAFYLEIEGHNRSPRVRRVQ